MPTITRLIEDFKAGDAFSQFILILNALAIVTIPVVIAVKVHSEQRWNTFVEKHQCAKVGQDLNSDVFGTKDFNNIPAAYGNGSSINNAVYTQPRTGWQCDNGMTYWR